eukprot:gnl/MRDRNA2_/MRDRNA2_122450_c0_seq1.p1 gnl/MRDRNA2_/MRDRNA2_122450_c0~~gnl/MRDRNA2_/MRDRNA2_122450_c0_seq1.p1  ORF type:complete len:291 (+),score=43.24 gnl/MRDRNA2_/MRDRNA2_122450_c0_seq1:111-983(+)
MQSSLFLCYSLASLNMGSEDKAGQETVTEKDWEALADKWVSIARKLTISGTRYTDELAHAAKTEANEARDEARQARIQEKVQAWEAAADAWEDGSDAILVAAGGGKASLAALGPRRVAVTKALALAARKMAAALEDDKVTVDESEHPIRNSEYWIGAAQAWDSAGEVESLKDESREVWRERAKEGRLRITEHRRRFGPKVIYVGPPPPEEVNVENVVSDNQVPVSRTGEQEQLVKLFCWIVPDGSRIGAAILVGLLTCNGVIFTLLYYHSAVRTRSQERLLGSTLDQHGN